ncbi:class I SAM-dependent methyltransferase [Olivibacter sitiensis]|uniref:class I SAM-dependent methyltransferase n=1 Tax=Olivibacter sitiensis TaxID=376470 RepID=UPI00042A7741|nr:class I SAM-dependent methyltransferase [Olivibacter sitiensis]
MGKEEQQIDYQWLAGQLAHPSGEGAKKVAEQMALSNAGMIGNTIAQLETGINQRILEIGMGNGSHMYRVFEQLIDCVYYGVDVSREMIAEATKANRKWVDRGRMLLQQINGESLPFADNTFELVFTVNTLYFFKEPERFIAEIFRVMKPNGKLYLAFADRSFMETLPFVQYGFRLYDLAAATMLLTTTTWPTTVQKIITKDEDILSNAQQQQVKRKYHIIVVRKMADRSHAEL